MKTPKKLAIALWLALAVQACKKEEAQAPPNATENNQFEAASKSTAAVSSIDPQLPATTGFFMDSWQTRTFNVASYLDLQKPTYSSVTVTVNPNQVVSKVPSYIYGNNANAYMGPMVNEPVLLNHVTNLAPRIIRVPGGSFSDTYFWNRSPEQKPTDVPDQLYDPSGNVIPAGGYWYGRNTGTWTCTLDNYYQMLQTTRSTGLITVNYGYARYGTSAHPVQTAAHLAADWVRYDKGRTKYWEVGNECFGNWEAGFIIDVTKNKDGQPKIITGQLYGKHFKVFADSMRKAAAEIGSTIKIGAVMIDRSEASGEEVSNWNDGVLAAAGNAPDYYSVHNYYTPYAQNSTPSIILNSAATVTRDIMDWMKTSAVKAGVIQKPVALTEWNIFAEGSKQMISNISGLHSALVLGELIKNQYGVACRWDLANNGAQGGNDMGMLNAKAANTVADPKWNPRPAFYYMYYFQKFFGDRMVASTVQGNTDVVSYASTFSSGQVGVVLVNKSNKGQAVTINTNNYTPGAYYYYYTLQGGTDDPNFSRKVYVNGATTAGAEGGPLSYAYLPPYRSATQGGIKVWLPAYGAVFSIVSKP
ncbi:alpha-L-arabinofuranosidase [Mucilaginibacter sp. PAMB04168]|uniref:alpha-L-arabinofuranosidase n=1 Tax=Mucilaginibacter sp. PAMB04168 TaxID=3138567 RepID=UPI0031F6A36A